jgi:signal peptidase I
MAAVYATGDYTWRAIADAFGVHYATVSRAINKGVNVMLQDLTPRADPTIRKRRRWIAVLLAIVFTPFFSMLYLGKGRRALVYLLLTIVSAGLGYWLASKGFWPRGIDRSLLSTLVSIVGAIDSYKIARQYQTEFSGPWYSRWYGLAGVLMSIVFVTIGIRSFVIEPFRIPSTAMTPTLLVGDVIVVNKFVYGIRLPIVYYKLIDIRQPMRGDVMVFRYPEKPSLDYVKRVIGVPGDTVAYRDKRLRLNGEAVEIEAAGEYTYVDTVKNDVTVTRYQEQLTGHLHSILIEPDAPVIQLAGVRQFPYRDKCVYDDRGFTCTVPPNHYFMMGNNRDHTSDSRYWGFVAEENIVGKAVMIVWNGENPRRAGTSIR